MSVERHARTRRREPHFRLPRRQPGERQSLGEHALTGAGIAQFAKPFGPDAQTPTAMILTGWATDPLTATTDHPTAAGHPSPASSSVHDPLADRLILARIEASPQEAGYLAGAIEAPTPAATRLLGRLSQ